VASFLWEKACSRKWSGKEEKLTAEVLDRFAELITVALGLVAALAWNTAIQNLFTLIFGEAGSALVGQFIYAIIITLVVIFATMAGSRAAERARLPGSWKSATGSRIEHLDGQLGHITRAEITSSLPPVGEFPQRTFVEDATADGGRRRPRAPRLRPHR